MFLGFLRMPLDLVYLGDYQARTSVRVTNRDLPATILILRMRGRQRYTTLVVVEVRGPDSSQNILSTPWCFQQMSGQHNLTARGGLGLWLTFNRDTSVTRPNGPAIELSSTSVFAPLTLKENSRSQLPSRADARSSRNTPSSGSRSGPFSQSP